MPATLSHLTGTLTRHPRGAWGDRTHTYSGTLYVGCERISFYAVRNFDRNAPSGQRVTWDVPLNRVTSNRELTAAKWAPARAAVLKAFKGAIEELLNADLDTSAAPSEIVAADKTDAETVSEIVADVLADDSTVIADGIESGLTGPDWEPTLATLYFAQSTSDESRMAFGPTRAAAIASLKATPVLVANTTRACYWRTLAGFVATGPNVLAANVRLSGGAYPRLDALMRLKGETPATIDRALRDAVLASAVLASAPETDTDKADALRAALSQLAGELEGEGNNTAARLVYDARAAINTLLDRDAARIVDAIRASDSKADAVAALEGGRV